MGVASDNLGTLLAEAAQRYGVDDLLAGAHAVHDALAQAGLAANEPVHVRVSNRRSDLAAYLGVWLAGGVVVPVHRSSPEGTVQHISADAQNAEPSAAQSRSSAYRALVALERDQPDNAASRLPLVPGMLVNAEIHLGTRSVIEYLLSPVQKIAHEAGRER